MITIVILSVQSPDLEIATSYPGLIIPKAYRQQIQQSYSPNTVRNQLVSQGKLYTSAEKKKVESKGTTQMTTHPPWILFAFSISSRWNTRSRQGNMTPDLEAVDDNEHIRSIGSPVVYLAVTSVD